MIAGGSILAAALSIPRVLKAPRPRKEKEFAAGQLRAAAAESAAGSAPAAKTMQAGSQRN
jgi:hypothetical protein